MPPLHGHSRLIFKRTICWSQRKDFFWNDFTNTKGKTSFRYRKNLPNPTGTLLPGLWFCWRKGGVWDKQSRLCWKKTNMFVVPWAHIFPNIVLDLEHSGGPCPGRETQSSVPLNPRPVPGRIPKLPPTFPDKQDGPEWTGWGQGIWGSGGWGTDPLTSLWRLDWRDGHFSSDPRPPPLNRKNSPPRDAFLKTALHLN